eukprot:2258632-Rhodomonas_salina.1
MREGARRVEGRARRGWMPCRKRAEQRRRGAPVGRRRRIGAGLPSWTGLRALGLAEWVERVSCFSGTAWS